MLRTSLQGGGQTRVELGSQAAAALEALGLEAHMWLSRTSATSVTNVFLVSLARPFSCGRQCRQRWVSCTEWGRSTRCLHLSSSGRDGQTPAQHRQQQRAVLPPLLPAGLARRRRLSPPAPAAIARRRQPPGNHWQRGSGRRRSASTGLCRSAQTSAALWPGGRVVPTGLQPYAPFGWGNGGGRHHGGGGHGQPSHLPTVLPCPVAARGCLEAYAESAPP